MKNLLSPTNEYGKSGALNDSDHDALTRTLSFGLHSIDAPAVLLSTLTTASSYSSHLVETLSKTFSATGIFNSTPTAFLSLSPPPSTPPIPQSSPALLRGES